MSQHPSLKISKAGKKIRTVLKRYERFLALRKKGTLKDDSSVFGMPKLKVARAKIKKEKAAEKPEEGQVAAEGEILTQEATKSKKETPSKTDKSKGKEGKKK
ncbi:small basic protein [Candidatus Omnitrophota bacterium]